MRKNQTQTKTTPTHKAKHTTPPAQQAVQQVGTERTLLSH